MERYKASGNALRTELRIWFAAMKEIKDAGAAVTIWVNGGPRKYSLQELTFYPYSKEGRADENIVFQNT
jgi:hypothetical protein